MCNQLPCRAKPEPESSHLWIPDGKNTLGWAWSKVRSFSVEHRNAVYWIQEDQCSWLLASWLGMDELVWIKQQLVWLGTGLQLSLGLEGSKQYKAFIISILTCCHLSAVPGCSSTADRQQKDGTFLGWVERKRSPVLSITRHVSFTRQVFSLNPGTHQKKWTSAYFYSIQPVAVKRKVPITDRFSSGVSVNFLWRRFVRAGALKTSM